MGAQDPDNKPAEDTEGTEGAGAEGQEPTNGTNGEGASTEGTEGQGGSNEGGEGNGEGGKPGATVNRHKYERELAAKDKTIAELQAQIDEAAKTKEGRDDLQKKLDEMKAELDGEKVAHKLEVAGCRNVKAARALLDDYDGDVAKLKEACPYLFGKDKQTGSTGFKPEGTSTDDDEALDRAFGLRK